MLLLFSFETKSLVIRLIQSLSLPFVTVLAFCVVVYSLRFDSAEIAYGSRACFLVPPLSVGSIMLRICLIALLFVLSRQSEASIISKSVRN